MMTFEEAKDRVEGQTCPKCRNGGFRGPVYVAPHAPTFMSKTQPEYFLWPCSGCGFAKTSECAE